LSAAQSGTRMVAMKEQAQKLADIFSIFSNEKRVRIFWLLNGSEISVNDIAAMIDTSVQNASQHLRLMKERDILATRRDGQNIYYRVADSRIARYCQVLHQIDLEEQAEFDRM